MAGWPPNVGLNLIPALGNLSGNPQQFSHQLQGLQMVQAQLQQHSNQQQYVHANAEDRRQISDTYNERDKSRFDNYDNRSFRKRCHDQNIDKREYLSEDCGRIGGLIDHEILPDFVLSKRDFLRQDASNGKAEVSRRGSGVSKPNLQPELSKLRTEGHDQFQYSRGPIRLNPNEMKHGRRDEFTVPLNAVLHPNCYLVPPEDDLDVLPLNDKEPGCRSIFIRSLPGMADEFIIREIFGVFGTIENLSLKTMKNNTNVRHCHLTFSQLGDVDMAVKLNGYLLVIGDGNDTKTKVSRIRINYFKVTRDEIDVKTTSTVTEHQQKPYQHVGEDDTDLIYSRTKAFQLLDLIRHDKSVVNSLEMMTHWLVKGECNRSTVNVFHTMLSTVNGLVKRLINKRKEHEQQVENQKREAAERTSEIKQQCDAVWKVFDAATKQKAWDQFTKGQRKTISQWFAIIRNEIKSAQEAEIQNREEVGMDLDDEASNLGGLIEQPALQVAQEQRQEEDESLAPAAAKKLCSDASGVESGADSIDALKLENAKLRTQVESLKAIAEQNTNLMWSMQSYQYQVDMTRQQYDKRLKEKDYEILCLQKALEHIKQNIKQGDLISGELVATVDPLKDLEVVVELSSGSHAAINGVETNYCDTHGEGKRERMEDDRTSKIDKIAEASIRDKLDDTVTEVATLSNKGVKELDVTEDKVEDNVKEGEIVCIGEANFSNQGNPEEEGERLGEGETLVVVKEEHVDGEVLMNKEDLLRESGRVVVRGETSHEGEEPGNASVDAERKVGGQKAIGAKNETQEEDDEEEGSGRFVQIDDEQFEVIDDMGEDSDDDYKEIDAQGCLSGNDEQVNEQFEDEDACKEVTVDSSLNEREKEVNEQVPTDLTAYQQSYMSYYQAWASSGLASYSPVYFGPSVVRLSGKELVLVVIISSYLQLCPAGATSGEIRDYLSRQFHAKIKVVVERLLSSLPVLFKAGESGGNSKWKFCGFDLAQSKTEKNLVH